MDDTTKPPLIERLSDEADQCRHDGADDIAVLLDEAREALAAQPAPAAAAPVVALAGYDWTPELQVGVPEAPNPRDLARNHSTGSAWRTGWVHGWRAARAAPAPQALPADLLGYVLTDLKRKRARLDGFISYGNEIGRAAQYDRWIAALEAAPQAPHAAEPPQITLIEAVAHRTAWRYKKSSDPHHSDTYTFTRATLLHFVEALQAAAPQAPARVALTDWTFTRGADGRIVVGSPIYGPGVLAVWPCRSGGNLAERVLHALADAILDAGIPAATSGTKED